MNRRRSSVYACCAWISCTLALILVLVAVRVGIDRAFDRQTEAAVLAQPLFWFLCGVVSLPFGVFGLRIRCGLRFQFRFLLIAGVYFLLTMLLVLTGLPTLPLFIILAVMALFSLKFWHQTVAKILSYRAFRLPAASPTAGDIVDMYVRVSARDSSKNRFAEHRAAR